MALYTILFGLSIFMIALVLAIIRKVFFHWKEEHKIERVTKSTVQRPAVSVMIYLDNYVFKKRTFPRGLVLYDVISKSDISFTKKKKKEKEIDNNSKSK